MRTRTVDPGLISRRLGVSETLLRVILARLEEEGYIKGIALKKGESCRACPLRAVCGGSCPTGTSSIVIYEVTRKGLDMLGGMESRE